MTNVSSGSSTYTMQLINVASNTDMMLYSTVAAPTCFSSVTVTSATFTARTSSGTVRGTWNATVKDNFVRVQSSAGGANLIVSLRSLFLNFSYF